MVGTIDAVFEHELDRSTLALKDRFATMPSSDAKVLEHVEGRVERTVNPVPVVPHVAVPPTVLERRGRLFLMNLGVAHVTSLDPRERWR